MIRVVLGLKEPLTGLGARVALEAEGEFEVVATATSPADVVAAARDHEAAVSVIDWGLHAKDPELMARLAALSPPCRSIVLVEQGERDCRLRHLADGRISLSKDTLDLLDECCLASLRASGRGCLPRDTTPERLLAAARRAVEGESAAAGWSQRHAAAPEPPHGPSVAAPLRPITQREMQAIAEVVAGGSNEEIAARLGIGEQTVKNHLRRITRKLGVSSRLELALVAVRDLRLRRATAAGLRSPLGQVTLGGP